MEALRVATYNPALLYKEQSQYGSIASGQSADLLLLDANPLLKIGNTRRIHGVMLQGRWLDRREIAKMLRHVAQRAKGDCWSVR